MLVQEKLLMNVHQKTAWFRVHFGNFDVLYLNSNWFSGVIWVICPLFSSTSVPSRSISKVGTESRGNLVHFCKIDACQRKWSTQACSKIIPEMICTFIIKQNNCLKYRNRCRTKCGYMDSATYGPSICYVYSGRLKRPERDIKT